MSRRQERVKFMPVEKEKYLTAREVAAWLGISLSTVYREEIRSLGVQLGRRSLRWSLRRLLASLRPCTNAGGQTTANSNKAATNERVASRRDGTPQTRRPLQSESAAAEVTRGLRKPLSGSPVSCASSKQGRKRKYDRSQMRDKRQLVSRRGPPTAS